MGGDFARDGAPDLWRTAARKGVIDLDGLRLSLRDLRDLRFDKITGPLWFIGYHKLITTSVPLFPALRGDGKS